MLVSGRMGYQMVKEHSLLLNTTKTETFQMEKSMLGVGRMVNLGVVKEHILGLMEVSILEIGRMVNLGTENLTTKTENTNGGM